jgi:5-methylcytosine-specific restriction endonuclease McrA
MACGMSKTPTRLLYCPSCNTEKYNEWIRTRNGGQRIRTHCYKCGKQKPANTSGRCWNCSRPGALDYQRAWTQNNREKRREYWNRRKAQKRGNRVTKTDYRAIIKRDRMICYLCNRKILRSDLSFDHVIPLSKGGEHSPENIRATHLQCNHRKRARLITSLTEHL